MWVDTFGIKVWTGQSESGQEIFQLILSEIKQGNFVCCSHPKLTSEEVETDWRQSSIFQRWERDNYW